MNFSGEQAELLRIIADAAYPIDIRAMNARVEIREPGSLYLVMDDPGIEHVERIQKAAARVIPPVYRLVIETVPREGNELARFVSMKLVAMLSAAGRSVDCFTVDVLMASSVIAVIVGGIEKPLLEALEAMLREKFPGLPIEVHAERHADLEGDVERLGDAAKGILDGG